MFTVALIGPDGVGKTTIARQLECSFPVPVKYLYMGDNVLSSNVTLPTTRWWKTRHLREEKDACGGTAPYAASGNGKHRASSRSRRRGALRTTRHAVRKTLGFCNRLLEEYYRQLVARYYSWRGYIVVFDRHFRWDYYHVDILPQAVGRSFKRRLHGFLLSYILREPDLVICLDAPGEVVFGRKGEFTPEHLEMRRGQWLSLCTVIANFAVVDATQPLERVVQDVGRIIGEFHRMGHHGHS
jgi:thymidylate kinase